MFLRMKNRSPGMLSVCTQECPSGSLDASRAEENDASSAADGLARALTSSAADGAVGPFASSTANGTARATRPLAPDDELFGRSFVVDTDSRLQPDEVGGGLSNRSLAWIPKHPRLAQLARHILSSRFRGYPSLPRCSSGWPALDAALGGGFAVGAVHEFIAVTEGAAVRTVALRTAAQAAGQNKWIFYLDTEWDFFPPAAIACGVPLGRLIVVRAACRADAFWVCEQALRCRAVAAVVLPLRTVDARTSRRLQLAAEAGGGLGLLLRREENGGHTFAASRLRCEPLVGDTGRRRMRVTLLKLQQGRPREPFVVELDDAADSVPASAALGD